MATHKLHNVRIRTFSFNAESGVIDGPNTDDLGSNYVIRKVRKTNTPHDNYIEQVMLGTSRRCESYLIQDGISELAKQTAEHEDTLCFSHTSSLHVYSAGLV